jgi:hypothetical protein
VSDHAQPDVEAFRELEQVVRSLGEELASFRRRAIQAENRLKSIEGASKHPELFSHERLAAIERENELLRARLGRATELTRVMLDRVRFLRQQAEQGGDR